MPTERFISALEVWQYCSFVLALILHEIKHLSQRYWAMAVFDEAQALKNATTKRAKAGHSIEAKFKLANIPYDMKKIEKKLCIYVYTHILLLR